MTTEKKSPVVSKKLLIIKSILIFLCLGFMAFAYFPMQKENAIRKDLIANGVREKGTISSLSKEIADTINTGRGRGKGIDVHDHFAEVRFYPGGSVFSNIKLDDYLKDPNHKAKGSAIAVQFVDEVSGAYYNVAKVNQPVEVIYLKDSPEETAKILHEGDQIYFPIYNRLVFWMGAIFALLLGILTFIYIKTGKSL